MLVSIPGATIPQGLHPIPQYYNSTTSKGGENVFTGREKLILVLLAVAAVIGALAVYVLRDNKQPSATIVEAGVIEPSLPSESENIPEPTEVAEADESAPEDAEPEPLPILKVAVAGAVLSPGVYEFEEDARVEDLLEKAGGALEEGDLKDINLAARLMDGSTLTVPTAATQISDKSGTIIRRTQAQRPLNPPQYTLSGWRPTAASGNAPSSPAAQGAVSNGLINLNTATSAQLETLPGVGPKTAQKIIQHRAQTPFQTIDDLDDVSGIGEKRLEAVRSLVTVQ
jgi:competence protein ComEA